MGRNRNLCLIILMLFGVLVWVLDCGNSVTAGPYLDSAHGNTSYGVNRPRTSGFGYAVGNCAHCHEQHASIGDQTITPSGYELFYGNVITKCDLICYECHYSSGTEQQILNYPYCVNFGGDDTLFYSSIYKQFCTAYSKFINCGSRHWLPEIVSIIKNDGYGWGFPADPNPCSACHNPHMAQRIGSKQVQPPYDPSKSPITRPSERFNNPLNLWGDDSNERMDYYASTHGGTYQAPYYRSFGSGQYEPSGNAIPSDGSDLPDYVTFCLDCHQYEQSDAERGGATVKAIDWSAERHGACPSNDCTAPGVAEGTLRAPYTDSPGSNYILSCIDCHEPHATKRRLHLIRRMINGEDLGADLGTCGADDDAYVVICERCHDWDHKSWSACSAETCHGSGIGGVGFHGGEFGYTGDCKGTPAF